MRRVLESDTAVTVLTELFTIAVFVLKIGHLVRTGRLDPDSGATVGFVVFVVVFFGSMSDVHVLTSVEVGDVDRTVPTNRL